MKIGKSESLLVPNGNCYVWRYLTMKKFKRLIDDQALYFCNAKRMSDQYEATIPDSTRKNWCKQLREEGYAAADAEREVAAQMARLREASEQTLISCWSLSPHESYALWKIYLGNQPEGVAIRTTVSRLKSTLQGSAGAEEVYLGQIRYRNYLNPLKLDHFGIITTKKMFYEFERELRLFITDNAGVAGLNVGIDLKQLIQNVYLSPFVAPGMRETVEGLLASRGIKADCISNSEIHDL